AHLRQNRATQLAVAMIVVMIVASAVFSAKGRGEVEATFNLENPEIQANLTLVKPDGDQGQVVTWFNDREFSRARPLREMLLPGRYRATVEAKAHERLEGSEVEIALHQPNQVNFKLQRKTRGLRLLDLTPALKEDELSLRYQGRMHHLSDLELPVN